jgi:hypothetical protein
MFAGAYWALTSPKAASGGAAAPTGAKPKPKGRSRLQERFERRLEERDDN